MRKLVLAFAAAAVLIAAVAVTAQTTEQPQQSDKRFEVKVTPEMRQHSRILDTLYFVGQAYGIVVLLVVLVAGWSARMRDLARRATKRPFLAAMLFTALLTLVTSILGFPLEFYSGYVVPHQFDLTNQSFLSWMGDELKGLALGLVLGSIFGALALLGIRKIRRWWLVLWLGSIPIIVLLVVIAPVFIDPIFNKFEPLKDQQLKQALLDEASRAGIEGSRVYQVNKSKQTKEMNAYVTGVGPTKRIVMWDTLLAKLSHDEILAVMGHEMGHYVLHHLWKGLAFGVLVSFLVFFIGQQFYDRGLMRWRSRWHIEEERGDPAALPWLLIVVSIVGFFLSPVTNGFSRHIEHQSDIFGLELTHFNDAMASAFVKFAEDSKVDPAPSAFIEFWRYSHPSLARRIDFVLHYKPWEEGKPNELWHGSVPDRAALDGVFDSLNRCGVIALHETGTTLSDGLSDVSEVYARNPNKASVIGYCFYQSQDVERAAAGQGLELAFGAVPEESKAAQIGAVVREELERAGFKVEWDGTPAKRIHIANIVWKAQ